MRKILYQIWGMDKKVQSIPITLKVLDRFNNTRFAKRKALSEELVEIAAKHAHENGLAYFLTVVENSKPYCHIESNKAYFRVYFLDDLGRNYMSYDFQGYSDVAEWSKEIGHSELFLSVVTTWEYKGNTDEVTRVEMYGFKPNGECNTREHDVEKNEVILGKAKEKINVSANWEPFPAFGEYDGLIVKEREIRSAN